MFLFSFVFNIVPSLRDNDALLAYCKTQQLNSYCFFFRGHIEDVYDISWTRDGNFMVSGSVDNTAIMWDINKGLFYLSYKHRIYVCCIFFVSSLMFSSILVIQKHRILSNMLGYISF